MILKGAEINIFEDGQESRDFIYVGDVVDALVNAHAKNKGPVNLGTGIPTTVQEVTESLIEIIGKGKYSISGDYRAGDIRDNYADISKISRIYKGFRKTDYKEGLQKLVEWAIKESDK